MSTDVEIANQALTKLGALPIEDFTDETTEADLVEIHYEPTKLYLLRQFPWRCATKSVELVLLATEDANQFWTHTYEWPADCLRIEEVFESTSYQFSKRTPWEVRGKTVLATIDNVVAEYIADIDESIFDAHVEQAMVDLLAKNISFAITGSSAREQNLNAIYDRTLMEAKTTDRQEASHKTFTIDTLVRER